MANVSDDKNTSVGGGNTDTQEPVFLANADNTNDAWLAHFKAGGATSDNWNTAALQWLKIQGAPSDNLADAWGWYWESGAPPIFINLLDPSEGFADGAWGKAGVTIVSASTTPPVVAATADTLTGTATSQAGLTQSRFLSAGKRYSLSIYAKQGTSEFLGINPDASAFGGGSWGIFNLATGLVEITGGGGTSPVTSMTDEGGGWYRCEWSAIADASGNSLIPFTPSSATGPLVLSGAEIFVAAAQLSMDGLQPYEQRL